MTIQQYIDRRNKIEFGTTFRISSDGKGHYIEADKKYTRREFAQKYPLPVSLISHNRKYLDGGQSYLMVE